MNTLYKTSLALSTIGCLNWGLVGLFNFNLVEYLFGDGALLTRIVYILVMAAGLIQLGVLYLKHKDYDKSLEILERVYRLDPNIP